MRHTTCAICNNNIPLNESVKIDSKVYCSSCVEKTFPNEESLSNKLVEKETDPTVCSFCNKDFGNIVLNKISSYPSCDECEIKIKDRTFPKWVKAFLIGIVGIVIVGFVWNWKYYSAYNDIKQSNQYFEHGDAANATLLMAAASEKVPEIEDLKILTAYYRGVDLLMTDKSEDALIEFNKCIDKVPPEYHLEGLIIQAKVGASFDRKDYTGFVVATMENLALDSTIANSWAAVASANACIYADRGDPYAKEDALRYLEKARAIDDTGKQMKEYYNMIEYRIDSKKIIKREEFLKQFPNGWTKNP